MSHKFFAVLVLALICGVSFALSNTVLAKFHTSPLIISIIFKLAAVFRLTIPLLYVVAMNTFWRSWYQAHQSLGDIIFFVLLGLVVLSWIISLVRKIQSIFQKRQEEKDLESIVRYRIREQRRNGVQPDEHGGYAMDLSDIELSDDED